jgi:hypothetical protein
LTFAFLFSDTKIREQNFRRKKKLGGRDDLLQVEDPAVAVIGGSQNQLTISEKIINKIDASPY